MKSQNGITLVSLIIYVIVMAIVIGILTTITTFFYKNIKDTNADIDPITEFTTFNSYFSDEVNRSNIKVIDCNTEYDENDNVTSSYVVFSNEVQYTYISENKGIYKNKVKICRNIDRCTFEEKIEKGKSVIIVNIESGEQQRQTKYALKK